jgi:hypothetical protein
MVRSWSKVDSTVLYLWTATEDSDDVLDAAAWGEERRVLQLARAAAIAGTCGGSCAVGVEDMRKVSARSVANSVAIGAISSFLQLSLPDKRSIDC